MFFENVVKKMDANLLKPTKKTRRKKALKSYVTSKGNNIREERKEKEKKVIFWTLSFYIGYFGGLF